MHLAQLDASLFIALLTIILASKSSCPILLALELANMASMSLKSLSTSELLLATVQRPRANLVRR